ncbi:hypothetical protein BDP81DRAFT_97562 [Colletotrichum phormii]|uniref:Uncharacterized protein n=1 Tax=Colletotrichum phormii TaxID=359342 RepID=A0AAJ0EBD9_9PEZI|nr:uncharacterized protein BDP81DRAFT_97562 [Colletotrichum phormii]KAK1625501.1 hypothetical protein BDP81DRAFT_97562 [Colletotrichum phormii]
MSGHLVARQSTTESEWCIREPVAQSPSSSRHLFGVTRFQARRSGGISSHQHSVPTTNRAEISRWPTDAENTQRLKWHSGLSPNLSCLSCLSKGPTPPSVSSGWQGMRAPSCGCLTWASRKAIDSTFFFFWDYFCSPILVSRWFPSSLRGHKPAFTGLPAEWGIWASSPQLGSRGTRAGHGESSRIQPDQMPLAVRTRCDTTYSGFVQTMKTPDLYVSVCVHSNIIAHQGQGNRSCRWHPDAEMAIGRPPPDARQSDRQQHQSLQIVRIWPT